MSVDRERLVDILAATFGPAPLSTTTMHGLAWYDIIEEIEDHKGLLDLPDRPILDDPQVQQALADARSAILHGVVGSAHEVSGVSVDEALGYAADLVRALDDAQRRNS